MCVGQLQPKANSQVNRVDFLRHRTSTLFCIRADRYSRHASIDEGRRQTVEFFEIVWQLGQ